MRVPLLIRSAMYALRGGFLIRPLLISLALGLTGMILSSLEEGYPVVSAWVPYASGFKRLEGRLAELEARAPATMLNAVDGAQAK